MRAMRERRIIGGRVCTRSQRQHKEDEEEEERVSVLPERRRRRRTTERRPEMGSSSGGGGVKEDASPESDAEEPQPCDPGSRPATSFSEGERVLAYHGPLLYEAKVQKTEFREEEWSYFVHYLGWSKNWDEWVGADRLMKATEDNVRLQQELEKTQGADKNSKPGRSMQNKPKDAKAEKEDMKNQGISKGKKRKGQSEEKETKSSEKMISLQFPSTIKKQLVDDWEFVTQLGKFVKLPRSPNVDDIIKKYLEYRTKKDGMFDDSLAEILKGVCVYFDKALPGMLLYRKERQQYHEAVRGSDSPSTIYGAEHLLRLFVKLPELLVHVNLEDEALAKLQQKLNEFLKYLQKNQSTFFMSSYDGQKGDDDDDDADDDDAEAQ